MAHEHKTRVGRFTVTDTGGAVERIMGDGTPVLTAGEVSEYQRRATIAVLRDVDLVSGAELKFARKVIGLRQAELAEQLGVTPETVSRWETGTEPFKRPIQLARV